MDHHVPLIATVAAGLGLALLLGFMAARLRLPALVGYLLAGVVVGPHTPGFVADADLAAQLAEIGVMLLMFGVGLHFSLGDLLAVRKIAVPGAIVQIAVATAMGAGLASRLGLDACRRRCCSACRSRWPAPWCCCARSRAWACWRPSTGASRSAG